MRIRYLPVALVILVGCSQRARQTQTAETAPRSMLALSVLIAAATSAMSENERSRLEPFGLVFKTDQALAVRYPLRDKLLQRAATFDVSLKKAAKKIFLENPNYQNAYSAMVLEALSPAPEFKSVVGAPYLFGRHPLDTKLQSEFGGLLRQADQALASDREQYLESFEEGQLAQSEQQELQSEVSEFLGIAQSQLRQFHFVVNPFHGPYNGHGAGLADQSALLVVGPWESKEKEHMLMAHEYAHLPLRSVVLADAASKASIDESACPYARVTEKWGYDTWESYVFEAIVRAISYQIPNKVKHESGFLYEKFFESEFAAYVDDKPFVQQLVISLAKLKEEQCAK